MKPVTHMAYADEAYYNKRRFRSIAVVSYEAVHHEEIEAEFRVVLRQSGLTEIPASRCGAFDAIGATGRPPRPGYCYLVCDQRKGRQAPTRGNTPPDVADRQVGVAAV
jgi:hypothetical protein